MDTLIRLRMPRLIIRHSKDESESLLRTSEDKFSASTYDTVNFLHTWYSNKDKGLGPVVQSIVSLMSWLVVKMLTVLVSTISNSQVFLLQKCK